MCGSVGGQYGSKGKGKFLPLSPFENELTFAFDAVAQTLGTLLNCRTVNCSCSGSYLPHLYGPRLDSSSRQARSLIFRILRQEIEKLDLDALGSCRSQCDGYNFGGPGS